MLDTSMLTTDVHKRIANGETPEQIAKDYKLISGESVSPDAIRQYIAKVGPGGEDLQPYQGDNDPRILERKAKKEASRKATS